MTAAGCDFRRSASASEFNHTAGPWIAPRPPVAAPVILLLAFLGWTPVGPERGSVTAIHAGRATLAGTAEGRLFALNGAGEWEAAGELDGPVMNIGEDARGTWVLAGTSLYRAGTRVFTGVHAFAVSPSN